MLQEQLPVAGDQYTREHGDAGIEVSPAEEDDCDDGRQEADGRKDTRGDIRWSEEFDGGGHGPEAERRLEDGRIDLAAVSIDPDVAGLGHLERDAGVPGFVPVS